MAQVRHYVPRDYSRTAYGNRNYNVSGRKRKSTGKRRSRRRPLMFIALAALVLCVAAVLVFVILYKDVHFQHFVELGDPLPPASAFAKSPGVSVEYITDISGIDPAKTGSNWIHVSVNGEDRLVNLAVRDSIPPKAQPVDIIISVSDKVTPDQLVSDLSDAGLVKLNWNRQPDFGVIGDYQVVISVQDMSGNTTNVTSMVHIRVVVDEFVLEAGSEPPTLADFLADKSVDAKLLTDISALPLGTPGSYDVSIDVGGTTYASKIVVRDTVAPQITVQSVHVTPGGQARPEDFIIGVADASAVSYKFASQPDYNAMGSQQVGIIATDAGGNAAEVKAVLLISNVPPITVEARSTPLSADEFTVSGPHNTITLSTQITPNTVGEFDVELIVDGEVNPTMVKVVDTTSPVAEPKNIEWFTDHPLSPEQFVKNAVDHTEITYSFGQEPDWSSETQQSIFVRLTDTSGNWSEYTCSLTLKRDTEAPSLYGVKDRYCYIGEALSYFAEVFAEDNCDTDIKVEVDNAHVNINVGGEYEVTYTATDSSGNTASKTCTFTFVEQTITDEQLHDEAQRVLDDIITDGMSPGQKARAVFDYVWDRIKYTNSSNKTDWKSEAYRGITSGKGDCFTYFSVAKCLLSELGVETMDVERYGGNRTTHHYWLLVNLGTGWYHFDAIDVGPGGYKCFMKTDKEVIAVDPNFYSWNRSLYPATPDTPFKMQ